jgi:5-methylcytosine-specific restriction endonuclease McrA
MRRPGDGFYDTREWKAARARCLAAAGWQCVTCGADLRGLGNSRVDHIKSRKLFPDLALEPTNLRALCPPCDNKRHSEKGRNGQERVPVGLDGFPEGSPWA